MYIVRWVGSTVGDLAAIWIDASSAERNLITRAATEIDRRLSNDPANEGESRESGRRILLAPPLGVKFRVDEERRITLVLNVWRFNVKND